MESKINSVKDFFLIPLILIFSMIGYSTNSIVNKLLENEILISLKKFVSYKFFSVLFIVLFSNLFSVFIFPKTKIVSFSILLFPMILISLITSE